MIGIIKIIDQIEQLEEKYKAKKAGEIDILHYGNMFTADLNFLAREVMLMPEGGTYLEIGVCDGKSLSLAILASPPKSRLIGIDPLIDKGIEIRMKDAGAKFNLADEYNTYYDFGDKQITLIKKPSLAVNQTDKEPYIDIVLIDGNHSYGAILADFNNWFPCLKTFGTVIFDDYTTIPDVKKAVLEIEKQNPLLGLRRRGGKMTAFTKLDSKPINEFLLHK